MFWKIFQLFDRDSLNPQTKYSGLCKHIATLCHGGKRGNAYRVQEDSNCLLLEPGSSAIEIYIYADLNKVIFWGGRQGSATNVLCH